MITVIVPCYNQSEYLSEALDSVLAQHYESWECIIVDDGSTDQTFNVAKSYVNKDDRFKYIKKSNRGLSAARNTGLEATQGEWIQFLDADDYIAPDKFDTSIAAANSDPVADVIVTDFKMFIDDIKNTTPAFCQLKESYLNFEELLFNWAADFCIPIHCGLFKRKLFEKTRFNMLLNAVEDWVMWLDIFKEGAKGIYINEPLAYYRNNPKSMTKDKVVFRENLIRAYEHVIADLNTEHLRIFSKIIFQRQHFNYELLYEDLIRARNAPLYKLEIKLRRLIRKIFPKMRKK